MRVLVTFASRHGATREIAATIAEVLEEAGHEAMLFPAEDVRVLDGYDAVVLGAAVYMGRWHPDARDLVKRLADDLSRVPVWLFSSGPVGPKLDVPDTSLDAERTMTRIGARDHRVFGGVIDPGELRRRERAVVRMVKAPSGDYRDWAEIRAWAREIATSLTGATA